MGLVQTTGEAKFAGDIKLVGMHHAALVTSTHPHAKLLSVDASAALQVQNLTLRLRTYLGAEIFSILSNARLVLVSSRLTFQH